MPHKTSKSGYSTFAMLCTLQSHEWRYIMVAYIWSSKSFISNQTEVQIMQLLSSYQLTMFYFYTKQVIHGDKQLLKYFSKSTLESHNYPNPDEVRLGTQSLYQTAILYWLNLCMGMANIFASCKCHGERRGYSIQRRRRNFITTDTRWSVLAMERPLIVIFAISDHDIISRQLLSNDYEWSDR